MLLTSEKPLPAESWIPDKRVEERVGRPGGKRV